MLTELAAADIAPRVVQFDIPKQRADLALTQFAKQADITLLFPSDNVRLLEANELMGKYSVSEGARVLLSGTGLIPTFKNELVLDIVSDPNINSAETGMLSKDQPRRSIFSALAAIFGITGVQGTSAQEPEPMSSSALIEEVVVTARKREETTLDIPAATSVFGRNSLVDNKIDSVADLNARIPNFFFSSPRPFTTNVTMRGLGAAVNLPPGVGLYIDGAYQTSVAAFTLPFVDLERVEVLKGPQGTLYGRNSFAGVLNYITRPPQDEFEGEIYAEVGNVDTHKLSGSISGPIIDDKLFGRITAGSQRRDGFLEYEVDGADADQDDYDIVNARLLYTPTENLSLDFKYRYSDMEGGSFLYHQASDINDDDGELLVGRFVYGPAPGEYQSEGVKQDAVSVKATYEADNFEFVSLTTYDDTNNYSHFDVEVSTPDILNVFADFEEQVFSQEFRLSSTGVGKFNWLVGAYYTEGESDCCGLLLSGLAFTGLPGNTFFQPPADEEFDGYALFTDMEYDISHSWTLGFGLRYDEITKSVFDTDLYRAWH
jgi:iron complex outermembrane receptor protein